MSDEPPRCARLVNGPEWLVRLFVSSEQEGDARTTE